MEFSPLIYGKDQTKFVVNLEVEDQGVKLFILGEDGNVSEKVVPNRYWILSDTPHDSSWIRLKGNLHYKYGRQFEVLDDMKEYRKKLWNSDIYQIYDNKESCMVNKGITYYKGLKPKDIPILSFDLETTGLDPAASNAQVLLISNTYRNKDKIIKKLFAYDDYTSEAEMIDEWCAWVREVNPSILVGHNIIGYDLHYLQHRARVNGTDLFLGRDSSPMFTSQKESSFRVDGSRDLSYFKKKIYGRDIIDTMFLAYRYDIVAKKYDSYGLKPIIKAENLEKEGRQFYDASKIRFNFKDPEEWEKIKAYCVDDSDDALMLFDLMIPAQFYWTQSVPKTLQSVHETATGSQINSIMIRSYLQERHSIPKADKQTESFEGAISIGVPGIYRNCIRWDVSSLYPSIILTYNIYDKEKDPECNFLKMMSFFTKERLKNKKLAKDTGNQYYKDLEQSQKVAINSGYGFMGAPGLNFNSLKNAELITKKGREILIKAINWSSSLSYEEISNLFNN